MSREPTGGLKQRRIGVGVFRAVDHLLDHAIDLSSVDARFQNADTGAPVYHERDYIITG